MQSPDYIADDFCQPQFSHPPIQVQEDRGAPLLNCAGLAIIRQLLERLGVASVLNSAVRVLQRCKWYTESDHIITMIYNMLSGGSKLSDINRLREDLGGHDPALGPFASDRGLRFGIRLLLDSADAFW